jgi:hypothetical protein
VSPVRSVVALAPGSPEVLPRLLHQIDADLHQIDAEFEVSFREVAGLAVNVT